MDPQRLMHPLNDTLMGLSAVTFAVVSVLLYTLLAFEALTSRGWGGAGGGGVAGPTQALGIRVNNPLGRERIATRSTGPRRTEGAVKPQFDSVTYTT